MKYDHGSEQTERNLIRAFSTAHAEFDIAPSPISRLAYNTALAHLKEYHDELR